MPSTRAKARMSTSSAKVLFVALVFVFNFIMSSMGGVVFADKPADVPTNEVVQTETEVLPPVTSEMTEPTPEAAPVVDEVPVETEPEMLTNEVITVADEEEDVPVVELPELDLDSNFDCWTRVSLTDYEFTVAITSNQEVTLEAGSEANSANPSLYEALLPENFSEGTESYRVEGWDGETFVWTLDGQEISVSLENDKCESPTIGDIVADNPELNTLEEILGGLSEYRDCARLIYELNAVYAGPYTVFAPNNSAIASLVGAPATNVDELTQLAGNPDELCALIASHIVEGEVLSTDATEEGVMLQSIFNDLDGLFVQKVGGNVYVDGALVVEADLFASNGVVHVVNAVLLPQSVGTIDAIETDMTSPSLHGTINELSMMTGENYGHEITYCVVVRIDGVPYLATVEGAHWTIEEGVVSLNPTKTDTLFDVVVRVCDEPCDEYYDELMQPEEIRAAAVSEVVTNGAELLGLTMTRSVISYTEPEEETPPVVDEGEVLGEETEEKPEVVAVTTSSCGGKASCDGSSYDPSKVDSDGDGVVDSEDPAPFDPDVTGEEDEDKTEGDETSNESEDENEESSQNIVWWFLAGGGIVAAWYLLWQRSAKEQ